jgi:hypothetical protein
MSSGMLLTERRERILASTRVADLRIRQFAHGFDNGNLHDMVRG